jgi:Ser/Thr protein kinase RdoA (MazF antagonist)
VIVVDQEAKAAAKAFGLSFDQNVVSLCAYAPVYKLSKDDRSWVLKRTGYPHSNGYSLRSWLRALTAQGIDVVCPAEEFEPNPRKIDGLGGDWVIYPYIDGHPYRGEDDQIALAGRLLGQIHRAGAELGHDLSVKEHLPIHDAPWREEEIAKAINLVQRAAPDLASDFENSLDRHARRHDRIADNLAQTALPLVACSWDFKASNLVFRPNGRPVLVDPDHGGRIPRIYDLACSTLLFHCDCPTAPGRMFDHREWGLFIRTYAEHVELSATEIQLWDDVLTAAWMDEGLWLIGNWPEGWSTLHERQFLANLATSSFECFRLDGDATARTTAAFPKAPRA